MIRQIVNYMLPFTCLNVGHQFKQGGVHLGIREVREGFVFGNAPADNC